MNKWISMNDRKPEVGEKVILTNGDIVKEGWVRPDGVWKYGVEHNELWSRLSIVPPTHWMPLPDPPK